MSVGGGIRVSSHAVPGLPYLPRTKVGAVDLDRVTLLSALAGQDLVPKAVQEAEEALQRGASLRSVLAPSPDPPPLSADWAALFCHALAL